MAQDKVVDSYNMILLKNPMSEDFIFGYDNKRDQPDYNEEGNYSIKTGETRPFPKFIANVAMKHLIDKILMKKDPQGKLINNQKERDMVATEIFVREDKYDRPVVPTNRQIVEQMSTDMDRILQKNRVRLAEDAEKTGEDTVMVDTEDIEKDVQQEVTVKSDVPTTNEDFKLDKVDIPVAGSKEIPTREEMLNYAKNTLKMNVDHHMVKKKLDKLSDAELFVELQIEENGGING